MNHRHGDIRTTLITAIWGYSLGIHVCKKKKKKSDNQDQISEQNVLIYLELSQSTPFLVEAK